MNTPIHTNLRQFEIILLKNRLQRLDIKVPFANDSELEWMWSGLMSSYKE